MIDHEFWSDEQVGKWSDKAKLFYIGLWNFADDEGLLKSHNLLLKSQIFPYDEDADIGQLKDEIGDKVLWYLVEGSQYGFIRNFKKHQRIDHPTKSKLPQPPETLVESSREIREASRKNPPNIIEYNKELSSKLIGSWNKIPGVKPVKYLTGGIKARVASRLREQSDLAWWEKFFAKVSASDWLCGRNTQGWCATLDWVLGPKNMDKVLAGNYDNRANPQANSTKVPT